MKHEFTVKKFKEQTVYALESASVGASSTAGGATVTKALGGVHRRNGDNLLAQEAGDKKEAPKPRNFVAKNAKMGGAGQHRDKKKEQKQGKEKHRKPFAENFNSEYDDEAGMADNNLETLKRAVQGLDDLIGAGDNLPEWCQEKIAVAKSMLVAVWDYMESEEHRMSEGAEFGAYYYEQLAQQVFDHNPDLTDEKEILDLGYNIAKNDLGSRAQGIFRDEDFPSDFVSAYGYLKKQGVAEGSEQIYNILALDKGNALKKPTKLKWKASSLEDIFDALAAQDWYPLEINGVEVIAGKRLKQGVAEGLPQTLRKVVPGYAKREIDKKMDAGKFGKTDADKDANFQRYKKIQDKIKEEGEKTMSRAAKGVMKYGKDGMKALAKAGRNGASEKELDSIRDKHDNYNEGLDDPKDNPCWKGYHPVGTKKKGGRTVPNCVPKESVAESRDMCHVCGQTPCNCTTVDEYESRLKEMLDLKLAEKIPPNASVDYYIQDFSKSNAPQFRGKTKEKRRQMAVAAYYGSKQPKKKKK